MIGDNDALRYTIPYDLDKMNKYFDQSGSYL